MSETTWPNVGTVSSVGGTVESGYFNNTNTGINVTVPIEDDTSLVEGTVEIISSKTESGTYEAFDQTPTEIVSGDLGGSITVLIDADIFKDFSQYGDGNTMFFNASIQGLYRTSRVFFEQPIRATGIMASTIVAPSVGLYYLNSQYEEYALVPDRIKQLNYLIPNYTTTADGKQILDPEQPFHAIPKPYDLGIFANIAEGLLDGMNKRSDGVAKKYIAGSFAQISPGLPIPALARPWLEMIFNTNLYSGSPVLKLISTA